MNTYSTVDRVRNYLSLASQNTQDDAQLLAYLNRASRSIERYTRRKFYPRRETRYYDFNLSEEIRLDDDLLALDSLNTQNGSCAIPAGVLYLMTGDNYQRPPYDRIVLKSDSGSQLNYSGTDQQANQVTGFWGYHEEYSSAWVDTGTSLAASYAASGVQLSLAGAGSAGTGASDVNYDAPRIAIGDTLWIGGEIFHVVAGGTSGNGSPIVLPHINGTSANHHASGVTVYKFQHEPDIQWATERLTAWLYGQSSTPYETKTAFIQLGSINLPVNMAGDVKDRIDRYMRRSIVIYPSNT